MKKLALSGLALLLVGVAVLLVQRSERPLARATESPAEPAARVVSPAELPAPAATAVTVAAAAGEHPHPVTAAHVRNFHQVDLLHGAWRALERRDFPRARELVAEHRRDYPGQWNDMNEGLAILTECMERPTPEVVQRAQTFHREHTASLLRKRIRRFCLERG
jgi:hypothetical protein